MLITENRQVHNPKIKTEKPHLLWPRLMATDRFKPFLSRGTKIFFHECTQRATKVGVIGTSGIQLAVDRWEAERLDTACLSDKVKEMAADYQVVIVGSVDELTARKNIHDLKHCAELKPMPRGSAIAMPYGMIGRSCKDSSPGSNPIASNTSLVFGPGTALPRSTVRYSPRPSGLSTLAYPPSPRSLTFTPPSHPPAHPLTPSLARPLPDCSLARALLRSPWLPRRSPGFSLPQLDHRLCVAHVLLSQWRHRQRVAHLGAVPALRADGHEVPPAAEQRARGRWDAPDHVLLSAGDGAERGLDHRPPWVRSQLR